MPDAGSSSVQLPAATNSGIHIDMCRFEKQRTALVYAYPAGLGPIERDRDADKISKIIWRMNTKVAWEAIRSSNWTRTMSLKVECERMDPDPGWSIVPRIYRVPIDGAMTPSRIKNQVSEVMGTSWFLPEWSDARKFLVFARGPDPSPPEDRVAGIAFVGQEVSRPQAEVKTEEAVKLWSTRDQLGIVYGPYWSTHTSLHELFHMMGAVPSNPGLWLGTGGYHCWDGAAVMCYRDKGPRGPWYTPDICPDTSPEGYTLDCNYWTWFRAGHRDDSDPTFRTLDMWLENNWNSAGPENRFVTSYPPWDYEIPCELCEKPRGWPFVE